jgi:SAM-dependent methyltransferase
MRSAAVERIYRDAFGADYPEAAQPNAFYSRTTLRLLVSALELGPDSILADLGCGHAGPGLWAAQQTGASLTGIDLSPAGIQIARRRAAELGLAGRVRFQVGDVTATGLPDASCDAAISLDVLPFVAAKAAVREVARPAPGRPVRIHHLGADRGTRRRSQTRP